MHLLTVCTAAALHHRVLRVIELNRACWATGLSLLHAFVGNHLLMELLPQTLTHGCKLCCLKHPLTCHRQCHSKVGESGVAALGTDMRGCQQTLPSLGEAWDRATSSSSGGRERAASALPLHAPLGKHGGGHVPPDLCAGRGRAATANFAPGGKFSCNGTGHK